MRHIFRSSDKSIFWLVIFIINFFHIYKYISQDSSAKYYQNNKERLHKRSWEKYRSLSKEEKEEKQQYMKKDIKICLKMKNKG